MRRWEVRWEVTVGGGRGEADDESVKVVVRTVRRFYMIA